MIRALSLNLQHGLSRDGHPTTAAELAAAVAHLDVDVIAMQEADRGQPRSGKVDQPQVIAEALGLPHVRFAATLAGDVATRRVSPPRWGMVDGAAYGLAIASRWPVVASFIRPLPVLPVRFPGRSGGRWRLRRDEQRGVLGVVVRTPRGELSICSTHLSTLSPVALCQVPPLLRAASWLPGPRVVMGDFNLEPWMLRLLSRGWQMPRAVTFPARAPQRQIDHALTAGGRVSHAVAIDVPISDHRGLLVTVER